MLVPVSTKETAKMAIETPYPFGWTIAYSTLPPPPSLSLSSPSISFSYFVSPISHSITFTHYIKSWHAQANDLMTVLSRSNSNISIHCLARWPMYPLQLHTQTNDLMRVLSRSSINIWRQFLSRLTYLEYMLQLFTQINYAKNDIA